MGVEIWRDGTLQRLWFQAVSRRLCCCLFAGRTYVCLIAQELLSLAKAFIKCAQLVSGLPKHPNA